MVSCQNLRIIAGRWRGRRLQFIPEAGLRPTGDRLRETLFNWLAPFLPGAHCLDLFAGSGALGLEALSRGAAAATFVDQSRVASLQLEHNLALLELAPDQQAQVIHQSAMVWLQQTHYQTYDVVFLDPPFALAPIHDVLLELQRSGCLNQSACIYVEQPQPLAALNLPDSWQISHHKRAGRVYYGLLQAYPSACP
jgi:16S rRNA (guanine966-N2)-methyltransferase